MIHTVDVDRSDARADGSRSSGRRSVIRLISPIRNGSGSPRFCRSRRGGALSKVHATEEIFSSVNTSSSAACSGGGQRCIDHTSEPPGARCNERHLGGGRKSLG